MASLEVSGSSGHAAGVSRMSGASRGEPLPGPLGAHGFAGRSALRGAPGPSPPPVDTGESGEEASVASAWACRKLSGPLGSAERGVRLCFGRGPEFRVWRRICIPSASTWRSLCSASAFWRLSSPSSFARSLCRRSCTFAARALASCSSAMLLRKAASSAPARSSWARCSASLACCSSLCNSSANCCARTSTACRSRRALRNCSAASSICCSNEAFFTPQTPNSASKRCICCNAREVPSCSRSPTSTSRTIRARLRSRCRFSATSCFCLRCSCSISCSSCRSSATCWLLSPPFRRPRTCACSRSQIRTCWRAQRNSLSPLRTESSCCLPRPRARSPPRASPSRGRGASRGYSDRSHVSSST
mmetsp:Transcript_55807/g.161618  ORF Transcript_55807/g.161618 Transcript_55807/m.161618 type:complete len:361 (+) Transcript_55807:1098-2180(+)